MARPQRNEIASAELTKAAKALQKRRPASAKEIERWIYDHQGARVSNETIRKVFAGQADPTAVAVELLVGVAGFYGVGIEGLGAHAERRMRAALALFEEFAPDTPGGQARDASGWFSATAARHLRIA